MTARVSPTSVSGHSALVLENEKLRATVIPSLGGRVWALEDVLRDKQWIWHRGGVPLRQPAGGSSYDEVWAGGWEELFPNDAPGWFEGRNLPDHGEWCGAKWTATASIQGGAAVVRLGTVLTVRKVLCVKELRLAADDAAITVSYRIQNQDTEGFHFLFKQHLPLAVDPLCELVLPGGKVAAVDGSFGTLLPGAGSHEWPAAGSDGQAGLNRIPPPSPAAREFVYMNELPAGWCGVDDVGRRAALRMEFDLAKLPYVWLFLTYGGWRDCYTAVLEPCTNMPKSLADATAAGQSGFLPFGGVFSTRVAVSLRGLDEAP